ncbi:hypothetical protein SKAU_G00068730 [Synaphobranchus kaupii]|uniref:Uncharacterized protein n=1 Tax=Synaphobranchus kaupii TaxID=118154 RepID=A0A9Q1JB31_SYNKA|nr:hypothetical protein SKAU_G00068730 [Synaphobranchus kaupii]
MALIKPGQVQQPVCSGRCGWSCNVRLPALRSPPEVTGGECGLHLEHTVPSVARLQAADPGLSSPPTGRAGAGCYRLHSVHYRSPLPDTLTQGPKMPPLIGPISHSSVLYIIPRPPWLGPRQRKTGSGFMRRQPNPGAPAAARTNREEGSQRISAARGGPLSPQPLYPGAEPIRDDTCPPLLTSQLHMSK